MTSRVQFPYVTQVSIAEHRGLVVKQCLGHWWFAKYAKSTLFVGTHTMHWQEIQSGNRTSIRKYALCNFHLYPTASPHQLRDF